MLTPASLAPIAEQYYLTTRIGGGNIFFYLPQAQDIG
jgi:hypothetical protein